MYIQDEIVKIYFSHVSPSMILEGRIDCRNFPQREFEELMFCYLKEYSETEVRLLYQNLKQFTEDNGAGNGLNVFEALKKVACDVLVVRDNEIKCRYSQLQRWRDLTRYVGEDLLIYAFITELYKESGKWDYYQWNTILGHTNAQLNAIISQGISENHFHLGGSAPVFQLLWLKLMNNINCNNYVKELSGIDKRRRNVKYHFDRAYREDSMECLVLKAALIRAALFCHLHKEQYGELVGERLESLLDYLDKGEEILDIQMEIRDAINLLKMYAVSEDSAAVIDYAIVRETKHNLNWTFAGERKLISELFIEMFHKNTLPDRLANLMYAYLVMCSVFRAEIVQNNENVGFENFDIYNKRKKGFLTEEKDKELMVRHAVLGSFQPGNLKSLEIRISPLDNYLNNARQIRKYDEIISSQGKIEKKRFYYVYHFSKKEDVGIISRYADKIPCRDENLRKKIRKRGEEIIKLRNHMPKEASRIKGIDACSQEIGCRPEVFAPVFRKLTKHIVSYEGDCLVRQLKQTYHAGEDFLDVTDGLRAMDEAVWFLNMRSGDRFGHATVLGIDVRQWYRRKHYIVFLKAQDYLDNVVWLFHKLLEFEIEGCEALKSHLLQQYEIVFHQIYASNMDTLTGTNIYAYYEAWKLRGDEPNLYVDKKFDKSKVVFGEEDIYNKEYPENQKIRDKAQAVELYWNYHYNQKVRNEGNRPIERTIPMIYVEGVVKVQKEMQKMLAKKGIGIETNPSSNVSISTILGYEEHPILNLYNMGLKKDRTDCPQMYVSINTDDKGVFNTSLENEYALMAASLENMKDENGKYLYNRQDVYEWLNRVRIMGNQQVFSAECTDMEEKWNH